MAFELSRRTVVAGVAATLAGGCTTRSGESPSSTGTATDTETLGGTDASDLALTSPAFEDGAAIPRKYGKQFDNVNPPLSLSGVPSGAAALALIVDDPDAPGGVFDHWLVWNVPPDATAIPEDWSPPAGVVEGENGFGNVGYDGPRPPEEHTYRFRAFALDGTLDLDRGAGKSALVDAMEGHVLATATLRGTFAPED